MNTEKIEIVSSYLPCGMSWILNCFLELNLCCFKGDSFDHIWSWSSEKYRLKNEYNYLEKHFPVLAERKEFIFNDSLHIRWSHDWPSVLHNNSKIIFFVRDPRDAMYSFWKRANVGRFDEFLEEPFDPLPFTNLYQTELFFKAWKKFLSNKNHLIIRFEETKENPLIEMKKALVFLGIDSFSDSKIKDAIESSDFEKAREVEQRSTVNDNRNIKTVNRAGKTFEYRETFSKETLYRFGTAFEEIYSWLGYEDTNSAIRRLNEKMKKKIPIEVMEYIRKKISQIDSQPELSVELTDILESIIDCNDLMRNSWPVVNGNELFPGEISEEINYIKLSSSILKTAHSMREIGISDEIKHFAGSLFSNLENSKYKNYFLHRWFVLTGDDLNQYSVEQTGIYKTAASERLKLIEKLDSEMKKMMLVLQKLERRK